MSHPSADHSVRPGDVLAGKYRVERVIGEGGMGMVVAARHLELDELVAIKILLPAALNSSEAVARFGREARASVKIKSEHVARTLDVGRLESGVPYMVMEYLEGVDLAARLRSQGPLPIEQAADLVLQACQAVAEAHALGIIHRDLKPSNLFLVRRTDGTESVKVLDFGISKVTGLAGSGPEMGMTRTQALMGSPLYMSPEQMASSRNVDPRTDIWALGISLHELLTGTPPYTAENIPELCTKVLMQAAPRLRPWRPDAPDGLQTVIDRCLEKEPARRYLNVAELAVALAPFGSRRGRLAAEIATRVLGAAGMSTSSLALPPSSTDVPAQTAAGTVASWGHTSPPARRRKGLILAMLALLVIGSVVGVLAVVGERDLTLSSATVAAVDSTPSSAEPAREPEVVATELVGASSRASPSASASVPIPERGRGLSRAVDAVWPRASVGRGPLPVRSAQPVVAPSTRPRPGGVPDFGGRLY